MMKVYTVLVLVMFAFAAKAQLAGSGTEADPYQISSANDLVYLADPANSNLWTGGYYFQLMNDIDMSGNPITPIGISDAGTDAGSVFEGTFDGGSNVINNLTVDVDENVYGKNDGIGLFGAVKNTTIKNLGIYNPSISEAGMNRIGAFVGQPMVGLTISNCYSQSGSISCGGWGGSFVGATWAPVTITDCWSSTDITTGWGSAGIVGNFQGDAYTASLTRVAYYGSASGDQAIYRKLAGVTVNDTELYFNANGSLVSGDATATGLTVLDDINNYGTFKDNGWEILSGSGFAVLSGFSGIATSVNDAAKINDVNVYAVGSELFVKGLTSAQDYAVYDLTGVIVKQGVINGSSFSVNLPVSKGLYVVRIGTTVKKVMIN